MFTSDLINGQEGTQTPRWIGMDGVINKLGETMDKLDEISTNAENANPNTEWASSASPKFNQTIYDIENSYEDDTLHNPNPAASLKGGVNEITPDYIVNLNGTLLSIQSEYSYKIDTSVQMINSAKIAGQNIKNSTDGIKASLKQVQDSLRQIQKPFLTINSTIVDPTLQTVYKL
jgi:hypothetical protein